MELSERMEDGLTILEVAGSVDSVTAPDLGAKLSAILATPQHKVLIDFRQLEYISSAGFRVLFLASKQAGNSGGKLALCGLSAKAQELFSIAGFHKLFTIAPTRADGVAALR